MNDMALDQHLPLPTPVPAHFDWVLCICMLLPVIVGLVYFHRIIRFFVNDLRKPRAHVLVPESFFKVENACPRCRRGNLKSANFCRACGLMMVSHNTATLWMMEQRDMLKSREHLGREAMRVDLPNAQDGAVLTLMAKHGKWVRVHGAEISPDMQYVPSPAAPPPKKTQPIWMPLEDLRYDPDNPRHRLIKFVRYEDGFDRLHADDGRGAPEPCDVLFLRDQDEPIGVVCQYQTEERRRVGAGGAVLE